MLSKLIIIILLLTSSYIGFKIYIYHGILKVKNKDQFTKFNRHNLHTGSGIVFLIIFLIFLFIFKHFKYFEIFFPRNFYVFIISVTLITVLSFLDDKYDLNSLFRFSAHLIISYAALSSVHHIVEFLPIKLNILIALIAWVYIINVTNFIDGADGFCATIALGFFLNTIIICNFINLINFSFFISIIMIPILLIFILFNRPSAKLFMGDAGSIFLGFLIGYIIIELSVSKNFTLILSAYAYPLLDITFSLLNRILKGFAPWDRLNDFYFLLPKNTKNYKLNFLVVENKIFISSIIYSLISILIIIIALKLDFHYLSLLNFLSAFILLKVFKKFK